MKVLIAEDYPATRIMLEDTLTQWGYEVVSTSSGDEAWAALENDDALQIALLDWMMPGIDGTEICERLRNRSERPLVYTILLTCKSDTQDMLKGFEAGAFDFIAKPFDRRELKARLEVGARILNYEKDLEEKTLELKKYSVEMETIAEERAKQLVHMDRLATLGTMCASIAHELNNPVSFMAGNLEMLREFEGVIADSLQAKIDNVEGGQARFVAAELPGMLRSMQGAVERVIRILKNLTNFSGSSVQDKEWCSLNACVKTSLVFCENILKNRVETVLELSDDVGDIWADPQAVEQIAVNIITNAVHAMEESGSRILTIRTEQTCESVYLTIEDTGSGISEDIRDRIFEPFFTTKKAKRGTGLGLCISREIIQGHKGRIHFESLPEGGTSFVMEWPLNKDEPLSGNVLGSAQDIHAKL